MVSTTSMLVLAGLIDPVLIVPDLLERWAPLFEQTPIDLDSSLTLGPVQLRRYNFAGNDIYVDLSGMTLESVFDAASNDSLARFDLGSGSVGLLGRRLFRATTPSPPLRARPAASGSAPPRP